MKAKPPPPEAEAGANPAPGQGQAARTRLRTYLYLLFGLILLVNGYLFLFMGCYWTVTGVLTNPGLTDAMGKPVGHDFLAFWAASALARAGDPAGVYTVAKLHAMELSVIGTAIMKWAWNYPPTFLLMVLPLSYLPYLASLAVWTALTLLVYLAVLHRIAPKALTPIIFLGFPGTYLNFFYGQNGFLSAALLGGGLLLSEHHPFWGGMLLGLLSYKPQLACLIPVALVAGRQWRTLAGAATAAAGMAVASLLAFGPSTWAAFWHNLTFASGLMDKGIFWPKMPTIFATARQAGLGLSLAAALQAVAAVGAAAAVAWVWYHRQPLCLRASILAVGTFLATPYAFEYDLTLMALFFAWLGYREYQRGRLKAQAFLIFSWIALQLANFIDRGWSQINIVVLLALFLFVWRQSAGENEAESLSRSSP